MDLTERVERGGELLRRMLGPEQAERTRQLWREICPDFEAYVIEFLAGEVWSRPRLDLRTKSLVTVATLAAMGRLARPGAKLPNGPEQRRDPARPR